VGSDGVVLYLLSGDIFDFFDSRSGGAQFAVDAVMLSTNVELCPAFDNPQIQAQLRQRSSEIVYKAIVDELGKWRNDREGRKCDMQSPSFKSEVRLAPATGALLVPVSKSVSPSHLCLVATDNALGSFNDKKLQTLLLTPRELRQGENKCLIALGDRARSVVAPFIGASKVDLQTGYISDPVLRREHIKRLAFVLEELLTAVECHVERARSKPTLLKEMAVIVWNSDILRVMNPKARGYWERKSFDQLNTDNSDPSGYVEIRTRVTAIFDRYVESMNVAAKTGAMNCSIT
jgi:hypothetical protein